ncbi:hypothetical protein J1N35_043731 [Gossypium stocksii]|uniref:Uncharacterized protein n=1 Tax=Gossypium stocksii TaxID=47602 RepID=A0A9D3U7Z3_9ROSI|nr:hypothetical protein J1N35_043731 [Gossypium stocksii]
MGHLAFNKGFYSSNSDGFSSFKPNYVYFSGFRGSIAHKRRRVTAAASLSLGARNGISSSVGRIMNEFNRLSFIVKESRSGLLRFVSIPRIAME